MGFVSIRSTDARRIGRRLGLGGMNFLVSLVVGVLTGNIFLYYKFMFICFFNVYVHFLCTKKYIYIHIFVQ